MGERKWTLVIVPPGSGASKQSRYLGHTEDRSRFGGLGPSALLLGYATVSRRSVSSEFRPSAENADLAEQIGQLKTHVLSDTLRSSLSGTSRFV
jgi:hypothetical protein